MATMATLVLKDFPEPEQPLSIDPPICHQIQSETTGIFGSFSNNRR